MVARDELHLRYLRRQPCCICRGNASVEAYHPRIGLGMQQKASDRWALPLCVLHFHEVSTMSENVFWKIYGLSPFALAMHYHANPDDDPLIIAMKNRGQ